MFNQICIAVVIENNNKILLIKEEKNKPYERAKGLWTIPAGKLEKGEGLISAAVREIKEETGYNIKVTGIVGIYELSSAINRNLTLGIAFRGRITNKRRSNSEFENIYWFNIKDIKKRKLSLRKGIKEVIDDYQKHKLIPIRSLKTLKID